MNYEGNMTMTSRGSRCGKSDSQEDYPWLQAYPDHVKWDLDIPIVPIWALLDEAVRKVPHNDCIDFLGKKYTYAEIGRLVNLVAKGLQGQGVTKGTKIGVFMPNVVYYPIFYYGILKAGGIVVNYNPLHGDQELIHQMNDSETEMMVTLDCNGFYDRVYRVMGSSRLQKMIVCPLAKTFPFFKGILSQIFNRNQGAFLNKTKHTLNQVILFDTLIDNDGDYAQISVDPLKDTALFQYTGGTTGTPKGAMLSHHNIYANTLQAAHWLPGALYGQEKILAALPLFHVYAMTAVMTLATRLGSEIIMMFPRFEVPEAIRLIEKKGVTFFPAVPTIYNMMIQHPDTKKTQFSSIKCCLSGAAALPLPIKEAFERMTGCPVLEAYGLSETSPAATAIPFNRPYKKNSVGIPFPKTEIKILSLDHKTPEEMYEVPLGERGQIAIKGPQVMLGYWKKPKETRENFHGDFFLTGDVGYMDGDGYTFLVDRLKDMIICSGFKVYPRNVEQALYKHRAVSEAIVIGIPDEKRGEAVKAFVTLKVGMVVSEQDLLDFLRGELSPIEVPKYIEFRKKLPKTTVGKLSKKELKAESYTPPE